MYSHTDLVREIPRLCASLNRGDQNCWLAIRLLLDENPRGFLRALIEINSPNVTKTIFDDTFDPREALAEIES